MLKVLIFLIALLTNNLYATYFSIQYGAFKNKNYAYEHKNKYCKKKCFIYINKNYYTVREGIFSSIKAAKEYAKFNELKDYIIVPIDLTKLGIKSIKKRKNKIVKKCNKLEKRLTPCRNGICNKNKDKKYPWEYDVASLKITPKIPKIKINESESNLTTENNNSKIQNEFNRFYVDVYTKAGYGQKEYNKQRIKDLRLVTKLGIQYGFYFLDNYHFYTDDRFIFSYKNYNSDVSNGLYFDINELYVNSYDLFYNMFNFVVGRKIIKDYNSLFYNSSLDLIGFYNLHDLFLYKLYFGTRLNNFKIKDDNNAFGINIKNIKFLIAQAQYQYYLEHYINFLYQYENSQNSEIREKRKGNWLSLRSYNTSYNEDGDKLFYYGNIAMVNGRKNFQNSNRGSELLAGIMYEPGAWVNKGIGASFAYSSKNYFQPYIANNKSNFLSKNLSFRYFGEFLDPELSNIDILSLYYKHIFDKNSLYLLSLHKYWKNVKDKDIYASRYVIPTGYDKDVGQEADFLYKYLQNNYYWQFGLSYFLGGKAFNQAEKKDGIGAKINFRYYW